MNMIPEQAVYSAAFTQALAVACCLAPNLGVVGGLECIPPNETSINSAKQWAEAAVRAWHDARFRALLRSN